MADRTFKIARDYCTELSLAAKTRGSRAPGGSQLSKYVRVEIKSREQGKNAKNSDLRGSQSGWDDEIAGKDRDGRNFPRITDKRFLSKKSSPSEIPSVSRNSKRQNN